MRIPTATWLNCFSRPINLLASGHTPQFHRASQFAGSPTSSDAERSLLWLWLGVGALAAIDLQAQPSACVAPPAGVISAWSGDGNAADLTGANPGTLVNGATFGVGQVGAAFSLPGGSAAVQVPDAPGLNFSSNAPMSVELWAYRTGSGTPMHLLGKRSGCGTDPATIHYQMAFDATSGLSFGAVSTGVQLPLDTWKHLAATFDGTNFIFYIDGQAVATNTGTLGPKNTQPLLIGGSGSCAAFAGLLDEVALYDRALTVGEVGAIFTAGSAGKCAARPAAAAPYFADFETGTGPEWSLGSVEASEPLSFTRFTGRFGNQAQTLYLTNLVPGQSYTLGFDFYAMDSWDGNAGAGDYFNVQVNGVPVFHETFSNNANSQTFPGSPDEGRANFGFNSYTDAIYRDIEIPFVASNAVAAITFSGQNLEAIDNESWGLDNVSVRLTSDLPAAYIHSTTLPRDGSTNSVVIDTFSISANRPLQAASATTTANYDLREAGLNGLFGDGDDIVVAITPAFTSGRTVSFTLIATLLPPGHYRFQTTGGLRDTNGTAVAVFTREFTLADPVLGKIENLSNDTLATATPLPTTESPAAGGFSTAFGVGMFGSTSDVDYWRFDAEAGDHLTVRLESDSPGVSPQMNLRNASDQNLSTANSSDDQSYMFQNYTVASPGTYYLRVASTSRRSRYQLRIDQSRAPQLEIEDNSSQANANLVALTFTPGLYQGRLAGALTTGDAAGDFFKLGTLNIGNTISVNSLFPTGSTLTASQIILSVQLDGNPNPLTVSSNGTLNFTVVSNGIHYVRIESPSRGLRAQYLLNIAINDGVPPVIAADSLPAEATTTTALVDRFTLNFSEEMVAAPITNAANYELRCAGANGIFDDADDTLYMVINSGYAGGLTASYAITDGPLQPGQYRLTVRTNLIDRASNPMAAPYVRTFAVANVPGFVLENRNDDLGGLATSLSISPGANADGTVSYAGRFSLPRNPQFVATLPMGGDTNLYLVTASVNGGVSVLMGDGRGGFQPVTNISVAAGPVSIVVTNFNNDTNLDLAVANYNDGSVSIMLGDGRGGFQVLSNYAGFSNPYNLAAADFNGDGNLDLAVPNYTAGNITVLLGNGDGSFGSRTNYSAGSYPETVAVGDLNNDGRPDLAVANYNNSMISLLQGRGDGTFQLATNLSIGGNPRYVAIGDVTGDHVPDLVVVRNGDSTMGVLRGNGDGTFQAIVTYPTGSSDLYDLLLTDLNADSNLDIVVPGYNNIVIFLNDGAGVFTNFYSYSSGDWPIGVAAGDFDNDGLTDLAFVHYYGHYLTVWPGNRTAPLAEDPPGSGLRNGFARGNLSSSSDVDYYQFTGAAGDSVALAVEVPGNPGTSSLNYRIQRPDGSTLVQANADTHGWLDIAPFALPQSGTYLVRVASNDDYQGEYRLRVTIAHPPVQLESEGNNAVAQADVVALVVTNGHQIATLAGYLSYADAAGDYFSLGNLSASTTITLGFNRPASGNLYPILSIYNAAGTRVTNSPDGATSLVFTVPAGQDGAYYAQIAAGRGSYAGSSGTALSFDGAGNYVDAGAWSPGSQWTVEAWVWPASAPGGRHTIAGGFSANLDWGITDQDGQLGVAIRPPGGSSRTVGSGVFPTVNSWYHVAGSCDGATAKIYINGILRNSSPVDPNYVGTTAGLRLGGEVCCGGNNFPGLISEVRIWNRALAPTEIAANMNLSLTGSESGLAAYWRCNEGAGNTLADASGHGHTGTLNGPTWITLGPTNVSPLGLFAQYLLSIDLLDTLPPSITAVSLPAEGTIVSNIIDRFTLGFSEDMALATVTNTANYELRNAGADGVFDTGDDQLYQLVNSPAYVSGLGGSYFITDGPLQAGNYRFTISTNLTDRAGNPLAAPYVRAFSVAPVGGLVLEDRSNNSIATATSLSLAPGSFGDASFSASTNLSVGANPEWIVSGLLNGDTNLDLVTANYGDDNVSVLLGDGQGGFQLSTNIPTGDGAVCLALADFNGDTNLDLAVVNYTANTLSILLGDGNGGFQVFTNYTGFNRPHHVTAADLNGDGKLDLVAANYNGGNITVLLGNGNGTFGSRTNYATGTSPQMVVAGDFNHDNKPDLAVVNYSSSTVSVLAGNGDGTFQAPVNMPHPSNPRCIAAGFLNNDSNLDLVAVGGSTASVYLGNGDGTFQRTDYNISSSDPYQVVLADLNGDSQLDLVIPNYSANGLITLLNNGDGTFGSRLGYGLSGNPISVACGDYNQDGRLDLATANYNGGNITILLGNASQLLVEDPPGSTLRIGAGRGNLTDGNDVDYWSFSAVAGDRLFAAVDNPGNPAYTSLRYMIYRPDGSYMTDFYGDAYGRGEISTTLPASGTYSIRVVQNNTYTGEYRLRVSLIRPPVQLETEDNSSIGSANTPALTLTAGHQVATVLGYISGSDGNGDYYRLGNLAFGTAITLGLRQPSSSPLAAILEVYNASGTRVTNSAAGATNLVFFIPSGGDGAYCARVNAGTGTAGLFSQYILDVDLADTVPPFITSDTLPTEGIVISNIFDHFTLGFSEDMTAATVTSTNSYELRNAGSDGVFGTADDSFYNVVNSPAYSSGLSGSYSIPDGPLQPGLYRFTAKASLTDRAGNPLTNQYVRAFAVSGVSGFVLENRNNNSPGLATSLSLAPNTASDGSFTVVSGPGLGEQPHYLTAGLLDHDAHLDLVVANQNSDNVSILLGNGDGTFRLLTNQPAGDGSLAPALGFFNADSNLDLAVGNYNANTVTVFLGNGDGTFQVTNTYAVGVQPHWITVADFNGDTLADLAVANYGGDTISILLGNGDGSFRTRVDYPAGDGPNTLAAGDINADGNIDLVAADSNGSNLSVLLGQGDGTFAPATTLAANDTPRAVVLADLNNDGRLDLAVANAGDNTMCVMFGNGDGTFQPRVTYGAGTSDAYQILAADLNGDNRLDLAIGGYISGCVSVFLNQGDGSFQPVEKYAAGNRPLGLAAGDFNEDGRPDLAVGNYNGNNLAVLLGNRSQFLTDDGYGLRVGTGRGNLFDDGDVDYWSFSAAAGDRLFAAAENPGNPSYTSLRFTIYKPDGSSLGDFYSDSYGRGQGGFILPQSGTYTLRVQYNNSYHGEYRLRVTLAPPPAQVESEDNGDTGGANSPALTLSAGHQTATVLGSINSGDGAGDFFRLGNLVGGTTITLGLRQPLSSGFGDIISVFNAAGENVANSMLGATNLTYTIPPGSNGMYYARVTADTGGPALKLDGVDGYALRFDGGGTYVRVEDAPALRPVSLTVEGWFNFAAVGGVRALVAKPVGTSYSDSYVIWHQDGVLHGGISGGANLSYNWNPVFGAWYHIAYTFDDAANFQALYLNGELVASGANTATISYDSHPLMIGGEIDSEIYRYWFAGRSDEVRLWNVARSQAEIQATMPHRLAGNEAGLAGYWRLDEGAGTTTLDATANGNNGTLFNLPVWVPSTLNAPRPPGLFAQYLLDIDLADTAPPAVTSVTLPAAGTTNINFVGTFSLTVSKDLDPGLNALGRSALPYGGHVYLATDASTSWLNAESQARAWGGHLATINDDAENSWVRDNFAAPIGTVWIGLTDEAREGTFVWASGEPVTYTHWNPGEPNNSGNEDYAIMYSSGGWNDGGIGSSYRGVVEIAGPDTDGDGLPDTIDPYPNDPLNLFDLRAAGDDGLFDTADDQVYHLSFGNYTSGLTLSFTIADGPLQPGYYRFRVTSALRDRFGNTPAAPYDQFFTIGTVPGYTMENRNNNTAAGATPLVLTEDPPGLKTAGGRGYLFNSGDTDFWSFTGTNGDSFCLAVEIPGNPNYSQLHYQVYQPNGSRILDYYPAFTGSGQSPVVTLPTNGTYTIRVDYNYSYFSEYRLRVLTATPPLQLENEDNGAIAGATPITLAVSGDTRFGSMAGTIFTVTDLDYINLGAITNGATIFLNVRQPANSPLVPVVSVYNAANVYQPEAGSGRPADAVAEVRITQDGTYYAVVRGGQGTGGSSAHYILDAQVVPTGTITFPNLQVTAVNPPAGAGIQSGQLVTYSFTVQNVGSLATPAASWADRVVMSRNATLGDADDLPLEIVQHSGALNPGDSYSVTNTVRLPLGISGDFFLIVQTDSGNTVNEFFFEADNVTVSAGTFTVNLTPFADLGVSNVSVPAIGVAGAPATITWAVTNAGPGTTGDGTPNGTVSAWADRIVFSRNTAFGDSDDVLVANVPHTGGVTSGSGYVGVFNGALPAGLSGNYYVFVVGDAADQVYEYTNGAPNVASAPGQIAVATGPFADLQVDSFQATNVASVGETITLAWSIRNSATAWAATPATAWSDRVVLSRNAVVGDADDRTLGDIQHQGALGVGEAYLTNASLALPHDLSGSFNLFVIADSLNAVYEFNYEGNNTSAPLPIQLNPPDLVVTQVVAQAAASVGEAVPVSWTVRNAGAGTAFADWWDYLYLSADTNLDAGDTLVVQVGASVASPLAPDETYTLSQTVTIPAGAVGPRYLLVAADARGQQLESNETNNVAFAAIEIKAADLQVTNLAVAPSSLMSGAQVTITWDDLNTGDGDTHSSWYDRVVVRNTTTSQTLVNASVYYNASSLGSLTNGQGRSRQYSFQLPNGPAGAGELEFTVTADVNNNLFESNPSGTGESNNVATLTQTSTLAAYPDLQVSNLALDPAAPQSGGDVTVRWQDLNAGSAPATGSFYDRVTVRNTTTSQTLVDTYVYHNAAAEGAVTNGQSLARQHLFHLPDGPAGTGNLQVTVTCDAFNAVFEYAGGTDAETNNIASLTAPATLRAYPDLQVNNLSVAPAGLQSGFNVTIRWEDTNSGTAPVIGSFHDRVTVRNTTTSQTLVDTAVYYDVNSLGAITNGQAQLRQYSFRLPDGVAGTGDLLFTIRADANNAVFEYSSSTDAETNNLAALTRVSALSAYPDLAVTNIVGPASGLPGQQVQVSWTTLNLGSADATNGWTEQVFLSSDAAIGNDQFLASFFYNTPLPAGQSVTRTENITIPRFGTGTRYLVVVTDVGNTVFELNEANDAAIAAQPLNLPATLTLSVSPPSFYENAGASAAVGTLTRNTDTGSSLDVALASSDTNRALVPALVTIPAGQPSATFAVAAIDDTIADGSHPAVITATAGGFGVVSNTVTVLDNDTPALTLQLSRGSINEGDGPAAAVGYLTRNANTNQALVVTLSSDHPNKVTVPATVTFAVGERNTFFNLDAVDNIFIEGTRTVRILAAATNYPAVSAPLQVIDNDLVTLSLSTADPAVSEGAPSPATIGTVTRAPVTDRDVMVSLSVVPSSDLSIPTRLTIPANQASVAFNVNARDDGFVNGARTNTITAKVISEVGPILDFGAASAPLVVLDNDGPTLTLTTASEMVAEGGTVTGTVSRNTETSTNLVVALASSNPGEAQVPALVTIPAGSASVDFQISGVVDHVSDGVKAVTLTASTDGFNPATARVNVSDIDVPDLRVTGIGVPATGYTDGRITVSWTVTNNGLATATGPWVDRVFVSTDPQLGNDLLVGSATFSGSLAVGQAYSRTQQVLLPSAPAQYWIIITTDAGDVVVEGSERNNTSVADQPVNVQPSYRATVQTDVAVAPNGTPIPLHGHAYNSADSSPARYKIVTVRVRVSGMRRVLNVMADGNGDFQTVFQPLPTEAGMYSIGADHPLVTEDPDQDQFILLGMRANPDQVNLRVVPNEPVSGQIDLRNLGPIPLSGLKVVATNAPAFLNAQLSVTNLLPGSGTVQLNYTLTANITVQAQFGFLLHVTTEEGAYLDIPVYMQVVPLRPDLAASPSFLSRGMLRGTQTILSFDVSNNGGAPSGDLNVVLPPVAWMSLLSTSSIPSLAPGEKATVTLALNPPSDLPLTRYDGTLAVGNNLAGVNVPFQFRAVSDAVGDLQVTVQDEYTFYVAEAPNVTNATVIVRDAISGEAVAQGVTGTNGVAMLTNIREGPYNLEVSADRHSPYRAPLLVKPGIINESTVFITRQTVTYRWSVVPIEIQDTYRVVLESVFETEVPIPNVIVEDPYMMPLVVAGQDTQFEIKIRNEGLIAANGVKVNVPNDPRYVITPLVDEIGVLPAKSAMSIPCTIRLRTSAERLTARQINHGAAPEAVTEGGGCEVEVHPCLPKIPMGVHYYYVCGPNNVLQMRSVDLSPVCMAKDAYDCLNGIKGAGEAIAESGGNVAKASCEIIDAILTCAGADMTECQKAALQIACRTIVGAATGGLAGAGAGAGSGLADSLGCLCQLLSEYVSISSTPPPASIGGGWGGGWGGWSAVGFAPVGYSLGGSGGGDCRNESIRATRQAGVCARVRVRIEQEAVMTRAAFLGTLEIENDGVNDLSGIQVTLDFKDEANNSAGDKFAIRGPTLNGLSDVGGNGSIAAGGSGSAQYTFVPTRDAAPTAPAIYRIGGTLRYIEAGQEVVVPLLSSSVTVYPEARLALKYFQQRDVYSDDPFTPELEPAEPFALGVLVKNNGAGAAKNFHIISAQPKIIENEKGLLIDFKIIGTKVGGQDIAPTLTANFGTIDPGQSKVAEWLLTSTLQGKFLEYSATFQHVDTLGSTNLSLIDSVEIHELIHPVRADRPGDDTSPDFLVNDSPDPDNLPDTLYLSDGTTALVNFGLNPAADHQVTLGNFQVHVTANMTTGWNYFRMPDPGAGYRLYRAVRSDGHEMLVGDNVWTTDRSFPSSQAGVRREHLLHLLDYDGTGSYTLYYRVDDSVPPGITGVVDVVPNPRNTAVASVDVVFSEPIDPATFDYQDIALTLNAGTNLINSAVTVALLSNSTYRISGLAPLTGADGNYELTVIGGGIQDYGGNAATNSASVDWAKGAIAPVVVTVGRVTPDPRNTPVASADVVFSRAVDPASFDYNDLVLTRDGSVNLITSAVTTSQLTATTFRIQGLSGLTTAEGHYVLTVSAAALQDTDGNPGVGGRSDDWVMDTTAPVLVSLESVATNPRNIVVQALEVTFSEPVDPATFDYRDITLTRDGGANLITSAVTVSQVGVATYRISNFNWVIGNEGTYTLAVNGAGVADLAGNPCSGSVAQSWVMDTTVPAAPTQLSVAPDRGISTTDGVVNTNTLTLTGTVSETNLVVRLYDVTTGADFGQAAVAGTSFSRVLNLNGAGSHRLRARATDQAGNDSPFGYLDIFVDTTPPTFSFGEVTPNPRTNALASVDLIASEPINTNTFAYTALTLTRDGGTNLVSSNAPITIQLVSSNLYRISGLGGLTGEVGTYELILDVSGIEDLAGNPGAGTLTNTWQRMGVNTPPQIAAIPDQTVAEGTLLSFTVSVTDTDQPPNILTFTLGPGAPAGAHINPGTGEFTWTPAEAQGPGTNTITVRVTDNGVPPQTASVSFQVLVSEVNLPPVLAPIADQVAYVKTVLCVTNAATDSDLPANHLTYSLGAGAPRGARINAKTGLFTWAPTRLQAPGTNQVTIIVTDDGVPPLSDSKNFTVTVGDFLALELGSTVLRAGESGSVPVNIQSSAGVTNLSFALDTPAASLTNLTLQLLAPQIAGTLQGTSSNRSYLSFTVTNGQPVSGTQTLASLAFTTASDQASDFVALAVSGPVAWQASGVPVPKILSTDGRVVVIADHPLLEALLATNAQRTLILYGKPGTNYVVETTPDLVTPAWQTFWQGALTNLFQQIDIPGTNSIIFYRAREQ